ncbi:chemotaxis protein [Escherichia coli]|nr:chemotaxis protein [Escherichia coli]
MLRYFQLRFFFTHQTNNVTNGAIVIHTQRLKSDPGGNLLS